MKKTINSFILLVLSLLILTSCWDARELDKLAYVIAIGLDYEKNDKVRVTYLIVNPEFATESSGATDAEPFSVISFVTDDIFIAKNIANTIISKQISYVLLEQITISEQFAQSDDFIRWMYDMTKGKEIRKNTRMNITKESAYNFLNDFKPKVEDSPYEYFRNINEINAKSKFIPTNSELFYYFRITETNNDLFLAVYSTDEKIADIHSPNSNFKYDKANILIEGSMYETQLLGSAVFKQGKMIGLLSGNETMLASILNKNLRKDSYILKTFSDPFNKNFSITTRINTRKKVKIKIDLDKKQPTINVEIPLTLDILTNHNLVEYFENKPALNKLRTHLEDQLNNDYANLVKRTQEEFKGQPFGWSLPARKKFTTIDKFEQFNWMERYPEMQVNVKVKVKLGSFGRQSGVTDLDRIRGNDGGL